MTVSPQSSSFSKKRSRLRGLPSYMGGLMSFKSSHTAASAALETMNAGREVDRGSHRPRPRTPTAATSISSMEPLWLRRRSPTYAEPKCSRRTASMYASSSRRRRLRSAASPSYTTRRADVELLQVQVQVLTFADIPLHVSSGDLVPESTITSSSRWDWHRARWWPRWWCGAPGGVPVSAVEHGGCGTPR